MVLLVELYKPEVQYK